MMYARLFEKAENKSVFFARPWFERTSEHFVRQPDSLRLYGIETDEEAVGLLVSTVSLQSENRFALPKLRILQACTTTQSFRSALLIDSDVPSAEEVISTLFGFLKDVQPGYECIDLDLLCLSDSEVLKWGSAIRSCGLLCHIEHQEWNRYENVEGVPFSKMAKKSTKRRERKLAKEKTLRYEMYTSVEDMSIAQNAYEEIYRRTWKKPDIGREFAADLVMDYAKRQWIRFLVIYADEQPIAAECFIVHNGIANSFRTAYDLAYKDYSVGSIVLQRMLEHVMSQDKITEIDFGPGDEPYKQQWLSKKRKLWRIRAYSNRGIVSRTSYGLRVASDELQRAKNSRIGQQLRKAKHYIQNIR